MAFVYISFFFFFFSSRRRHTRSYGDWSSDVCSSDLVTGKIRRRFGRAAECLQPFFHFITRKFIGIEAQNPIVFCLPPRERSEERRVGKECRSRWLPYH